MLYKDAPLISSLNEKQQTCRRASQKEGADNEILTQTVQLPPRGVRNSACRLKGPEERGRERPSSPVHSASRPMNGSREVATGLPRLRRKPHFTGSKLEMDSYKSRYLKMKPTSNLCPVTQSCPTSCDPIDCRLSMEFFRQGYWSGLPFSSPISNLNRLS